MSLLDDWKLGFSNDSGLGDTVSRVINKASFGKAKECGKCGKRKDTLNKVFPYRDRTEREIL